MPAYRPPIVEDLKWDKVRKVHRYAEFPTDPDERMNAITSSLNNGMKALTWAVGLSRRYRTKERIRYCVEQATVGLAVSAASYAQYAEKTMGPVGAIVRAEVSYGEKWRNAFALTEEGEKFRPVVQHSIKFFVDNDLDFYEVFGTALKGAPKTRIDILKSVAESKEPLREVDLCEKLNIYSQSARVHLEKLRSIKLLEFESATPHDGRKGFSYRIAKPIGEIELVGKHNVEKLRMALTKISGRGDGTFTYAQLAEAGGYTDNTSNTIISRLSKLGCVEPVNFKGHSDRSSVKPTEKTLRFYEGWIVPVEKALETEDFSELDTAVDGHYYRAVAERFLASSSHVRNLSTHEGLASLIGFVEGEPGITVRELAEKMQLGASRVNQIASLAEERGLIAIAPSKTSKSVQCLYPADAQR